MAEGAKGSIDSFLTLANRLAGRKPWVSAVWVVTLVFGIISVSFFLTHLAPGDPARIILGPNAQESAVEELRTQMGLDRPVLFRFADYLKGTLSGRWGESWLSGRTVTRELAAHLPPTLWIGLVAILFAATSAIAINALVFARPQFGILIPIFRSGVALPGVVVAMFCALAAVHLLPGGTHHGIAGHIPPGLAAGVYSAGLMASLLHERFTQLQHSAAFRGSRTLGFGKAFLFGHLLLPNSRSLLATLVVNQVGLIFFSTIVAEMIFSIRGIGHLLVRSIQGKDLPVIGALILANGLFFLALQTVRSIVFPESPNEGRSIGREVSA